MPTDLSLFFESLDALEPTHSMVTFEGLEALYPPEGVGDPNGGIMEAPEPTLNPLPEVPIPVEGTVYEDFNEGFFRSIPRPVREIVKRRMTNIAASSQLGATAAMSMVLLYRARTQPDANPETQAHLLAQSEQFFQEAVTHLQAPIPLEGKIVACLDLQAHQFDLSGAAAGGAVLLLGEFFVNESLGVRPVLDLANTADEYNVALRCFAYSDVLRTVCLPNRKPVFDFLGMPGESTPLPPPIEPPSIARGDALDTHLGLPVGLLLCLAATSCLAVDAASNALPPHVVEEKATAIEMSIRVWRALPLSGTEDTAAYLDRIVTYELWRQACLLYLYFSVHRLGPFSQKVRQTLQQFLSIASRDGPRPPVDPNDRIWAGSVRACPWFLAGTVAFLPEERKQCRQGLRDAGPQKGYEDNLKGIERIWELVDSKGWALDWREMLEAEKLFVGFL